MNFKKAVKKGAKIGGMAAKAINPMAPMMGKAAKIGAKAIARPIKNLNAGLQKGKAIRKSMGMPTAMKRGTSNGYMVKRGVKKLASAGKITRGTALVN